MTGYPYRSVIKPNPMATIPLRGSDRLPQRVRWRREWIQARATEGELVSFDPLGHLDLPALTVSVWQ